MPAEFRGIKPINEYALAIAGLSTPSTSNNFSRHHLWPLGKAISTIKLQISIIRLVQYVKLSNKSGDNRVRSPAPVAYNGLKGF